MGKKYGGNEKPQTAYDYITDNFLHTSGLTNIWYGAVANAALFCPPVLRVLLLSEET